MTSSTQARVVLVGFEDQDNLGLRYLSSRLRGAGHSVSIVTLAERHDAVVKEIAQHRPHVVGFSLIFQYLVPQFAQLIGRLRAHGIGAHFTIGGHYPSFEPAALLKAIPQLDSVVRFEGEDTLLELCERIVSATSWSDVAGIAYRTPLGVAVSPQRPGRRDLDELPWPDRDDIRYEQQRLPVASMLGGRGCPWVCSFCSIITFYEANGTRGRRRRDPAKIVDEMEYLHRERGVRIILWQDDDFLAGGRAGVAWAHAIADEALRRGLGQLRWKISCRSDEVTRATLEPLVRAGLTHVYLGVESGDPDDLKHLNKRLDPGVHLRAGEVLRDLNLSFDFGFMLLEPWSTFATVRNNLSFLREFTSDGASPVSFCRTLPYAGTPIRERLRAEGRLDEGDMNADYRFLDPRLDLFYDWLLRTFGQRNSSADGTGNLLRLLLFEAHLDLAERPVNLELRNRCRQFTALANGVVLDIVEAALDYLHDSGGAPVDPSFLATLTALHAHEDARLHRDLAHLLGQQHHVTDRVHVTR